MSTKTAMALCFSLAYIVALVGVAASLIRKPPRKPWGSNPKVSGDGPQGAASA